MTDFTDDLDEVESLVSTIDGTALELESDYGGTCTLVKVVGEIMGLNCWQIDQIEFISLGL